MRRELPISVVLFPNQMNPRSVMPVEKLMEVLEKQSFFCSSISMIPKPPSILGLQNFQATLGGVFALISDPLQRQCFLYLSICVITVLGRAKVHIKKVGRMEKTAFVIWSLPAWFRKEERLVNLFSHLLIIGRKS